jgi:hypothetical protein
LGDAKIEWISPYLEDPGEADRWQSRKSVTINSRMLCPFTHRGGIKEELRMTKEG